MSEHNRPYRDQQRRRHRFNHVGLLLPFNDPLWSFRTAVPTLRELTGCDEFTPAREEWLVKSEDFDQ